MNRMRIIRLTTLAVAALAIAGCKREPEPAPPAPIAEAAPAPAADAVTGEVDHGSPASDAPGFDVKAFAGTYAGLVRCAGRRGQCHRKRHELHADAALIARTVAR